MVAMGGAWLLRGCAWLLWGGMRGCSGGGGVCVVAPEGRHAWLLLGGHAWLLLGGHAWLLWGVRGCLGGHAWLLWGACVVAAGGRAWLLLGGVRGCSGGCVGYDEIRRYDQ